MEDKIHWWNINLSIEEVGSVTSAINDRCVSMGRLTKEFESRLADRLGVQYAVCVPNGTMALMVAYLACGVGPGTEVIVPDRTAIATAHAAMLLGAEVVFVDVQKDLPVVDCGQIAEKISDRTRVIAPVHLSGFPCDISRILDIGKQNNIDIVEDTCQAVFSSVDGKSLGSFGRFGCFSLGMVKMMTTGQGGFLCCNSTSDYELLVSIRDQYMIADYPASYARQVSGNFKFNDILASIGLAQFDKVDRKIESQKAIHKAYSEGLSEAGSVRFLEGDLDSGMLPLNALAVVTEREKFVRMLEADGIGCKPHVRSMSEIAHLKACGAFPNSMFFSEHEVCLPCGPDQPIENIAKTIEVIKKIDVELRPW